MVDVLWGGNPSGRRWAVGPPGEPQGSSPLWGASTHSGTLLCQATLHFDAYYISFYFTRLHKQYDTRYLRSNGVDQVCKAHWQGS